MQSTMESLLKDVVEMGASDLILTSGTAPQLRINGVLTPHDGRALAPDDTVRLIHSFLTREQVQTLEEQRFLDFSHEFKDSARFRISLYYQKDTLGGAFRIILDQVPGFDELGLPPVVKEFADRPHGLVLVTGPAGSGKSTTLAAMLDYVNRRKALHIICIEDPIEYVHEHLGCTIAQREIGTDARSFSEALRSVFRQTPDIIMIGEIRDLETMQLALTLAETGHLILGTLHTQDTTHSINRIVDSFPAHQQDQVYGQLALVLQGVVSQQLLLTSDRTRRVLACEVLKVNPAIRNLIRETEIQQIYSVIQTARSDGMLTMNESLRQLVQMDLIATETAMLRSPRPKELARMLEAPRR